jgi:hypothetical protein
VNVGKYGDGQGGTDATPSIPGFHTGPVGTRAAASTGADASNQGAHGADWEAIKKANVPY